MTRISLLSVCLLTPFIVFTQQAPNEANRFLTSLNNEQRTKIMLPFDHAYRDDWHFLPGAMWERPGLRLGDLSSEQERHFHDLLRTSLSASGYAKTRQIMSLEHVLIDLGGDPDFRDPGHYHIEFYGDPRSDSLWAWSCEGHHVALHFTHVGGNVSLTPRFFGANPATIPAGPRKGERTLAEEQDLGFALINALNPDQRRIAIFRNEAFPDIVTANKSEVTSLAPVGIPARTMTQEQQKLLWRVLEVYLSAMPEALAAQRMEALQQDPFGEIHFGWAGSTIPGKPHYYRIQGRSFLIEYDNIQNDANHIHTVWRDFDGDFGRDLLLEHYRKHHK
ncbi:MAG: DUF3500 domain-containing protein [Saprospiraceae bacterium]|nr:DUF3500 domain-containing protein [Saprospiraceae bacterium]